MSEELEEPNLPEELENQHDSPATGVRVFPILAIMIAVFPVALGIGFAIQPAHHHVKKVAAADNHPQPVPNNIQTRPEPHQPGPDRAQGDEKLREGRYEAALHLYRSLGSADSLRTPPELALRIAICQEGLGLWEEALATYRTVANSNHGPLAANAVLGQARIWLRLNDFVTAQPLLQSLLNSELASMVPPQARSEAATAYAIAVAEQALNQVVEPSSAGLSTVSSSLEWSLTDALNWIDVDPSQPMTTSSATTSPGTEQAPVAATNEPQKISAADGLGRALAAFPNDRNFRTGMFILARLLAAEGHDTDAIRTYESIVGHTATPLAIRAAFNVALLYHHRGDLVRTCDALDVVIHGAPGSDLYTRSLILYGRTLMDRGDFREAAFQLKRATGSRHSPQDQARAAVFLAMAQLLDGKPGDAAQSLFAHRLQFQDRSVRSAAALMTSLARCRTTTDASKDRESVFLYRGIVAVETDSEWLGPLGILLLGQAMHEADLDDRMVDLYSRALEKGIHSIAAAKMKLALAEYWNKHTQVAKAKKVLNELYSSNGPESLAAGLQLAQLANDENRPDDCLTICNRLQDHEGVSRSQLQKLAGRAYEQSGRPVLAARCYAGEWPLP